MTMEQQIQILMSQLKIRVYGLRLDKYQEKDIIATFSWFTNKLFDIFESIKGESIKGESNV